MDYVRSCYRTLVRFSVNPLSPLVEIQWYFVDDIQHPRNLPFYTRFASGNWANEHGCPQDWPDVGEVSPFPKDRVWKNGDRPFPPGGGSLPCGTEAQWGGNIAWPWTPIAVNPNGTPVCCLARPVGNVAAKASLHSTVTWLPNCTTCPAAPLTLYLQNLDGVFTNLGCADCGKLNNVYTVHHVSPCKWSSGPIAMCGHTWEWEVGVILPGPVWYVLLYLDGSIRVEWEEVVGGDCHLPRVVPFFTGTGLFPACTVVNPGHVTISVSTYNVFGSPMVKRASLHSTVAYNPGTPHYHVTGNLKKTAALSSVVDYGPEYPVTGNLQKKASLSSTVTYTP